jgi:tetratricopeptide (TPR) repeat protein
MRSLLILPFLAVTFLSATFAQAPAAAGSATSADERVQKLLAEAQDLQGRKRFLDALLKLDEAEKARPDNAAIYNMRGAIYLAGQIRDADKAREQFRIAAKMQPDEMPPLFNLTEADFVTGKWEDAAKGLADLEAKFPKLPVGVRHMVQFKRIVCLCKLGKLDEAKAITKSEFTFMDDTPAHYFANSVIAFAGKKDTEANEWMVRAQVIFKAPDNAPYLDSLMECGYVHSLSVPVAAGEAK